MRIRTIKPEFFRHEELYDLEKETGLPIRVAYAGLWCAADREGRFAWKVRTLKSLVLPFDDVDFSRVLHALTTRGFLKCYRCNDEWYGVIPSFKTHQFVNPREKGSEIPDPSGGEELDASMTRDPRVNDACHKERKGKERNGSSSPQYNLVPKEVESESASGDVTAELNAVESVWSVWPKKVKTLEAKVAIRQAIAKDGLESVLKGTKAIAEAHGNQGPTPGRFLPDPVQFFVGARYLDDPTQYAPREATENSAPVWQQIQALQQVHDRHPGNPSAVAYDRETCTQAMREDFDRVRQALSEMKSAVITLP